jgi:hypothetical protein
LNIEGRPGTRRGIDARALTLALSNFVAYLGDIDRGLSGDSRGTLDCVIADMKMVSGNNSTALRIQLSPIARETDRDFGGEVTSLGVDGLHRIETEQGTPAYLSLDGMNQLRKMVGVIGRFGVTGVQVTGGGKEASLSTRSVASITELIRPRRRSIGSIEGVLEMISVHKKPHFTLYSSVTKKAVSCNFVESEFLDVVKDSLGHRVSVSGVIHSNAKGEPLFVNVENIRHLRSLQELGSIRRDLGFDEGADLTLRGLLPRLTAGGPSQKQTDVHRRKTSAHG